MAKTLLHCAAVWDCDNCGSENFVRTPVSEEATAEAVGGGADPGTVVVTTPDKVTCKSCGTEYETDSGLNNAYRELEDGDDNG